MQNIVVVAIAVLAIVVASLAGRAAWKRANAGGFLGRPGGHGGARSAARGAARGAADQGAAEGELVAVITAAVAAASGMEAGSFRIGSIRPSRPLSSGAPAGAYFASSGFNTPAWGHVDRFNRGEQP